MRRTLLILLLVQLLGAATLREYNLFEQPDRLDLMLTFDAPYPGKISKSVGDNGTVLILRGVTYADGPVQKAVHLPFLESVEITPMKMKDETHITFKSKGKLKINASKTVDNSGLRIRVEPDSPLSDREIRPISSRETAPQESYNFGFAFFKVILILLLLILLLWLLKRWVEKKRESAWLFGEKEKSGGIRLLAQKPIDMKNRVALIAYEERKYLVLLGENNLLLDRIEDDEATFEKLLQKHGKKLGDYLET